MIELRDKTIKIIKVNFYLIIQNLLKMQPSSIIFICNQKIIYFKFQSVNSLQANPNLIKTLIILWFNDLVHLRYELGTLNKKQQNQILNKINFQNSSVEFIQQELQKFEFFKKYFQKCQINKRQIQILFQNLIYSL
ncbi:unnamed protein product [Paramecium sonneborni]|uniref:Uncharacterized protein n=1 Tax=Paramecium sonneborni TaxID=65129 RepID=A0A8S1JZ73_9CILI|nr:unnamed protein product [Paramecium sonneborni]